jgi:hypothetical protein
VSAWALTVSFDHVLRKGYREIYYLATSVEEVEDLPRRAIDVSLYHTPCLSIEATKWSKMMMPAIPRDLQNVTHTDRRNLPLFFSAEEMNTARVSTSSAYFHLFYLSIRF